jgi:hypothetical protein
MLWTPSAPHQQAGHVTAPDQCCRNVRKFLSGRRPHVTLDVPRARVVKARQRLAQFEREVGGHFVQDPFERFSQSSVVIVRTMDYWGREGMTDSQFCELVWRLGAGRAD